MPNPKEFFYGESQDSDRYERQESKSMSQGQSGRRIPDLVEREAREWERHHDCNQYKYDDSYRTSGERAVGQEQSRSQYEQRVRERKVKGREREEREHYQRAYSYWDSQRSSDHQTSGQRSGLLGERNTRRERNLLTNIDTGLEKIDKGMEEITGSIMEIERLYDKFQKKVNLT